MAKDVQIKKTSYAKDEYSKIVNRDFSFFTEDIAENEITIEEFFNFYEDLYLEIPIEGSINSHTYLVNKSNELVKLDSTTEEIQPLLDEIAELRQQLLDANLQIIELQSNLATNGR